MKLGLIGLQGSGKTTVWQVLTGSTLSHPPEPNIAVVRIPDSRLDFLKTAFQPERITQAEIELIDYPGFSKSTLANLEVADTLVYVIPFWGTFSEPGRAMNEVESELILRDLEICDARLKKLAKVKPTEEAHLLEHCKVVLEEDKPLRNIEVKPDEEKLLRGFGFLSQKPVILVLNGEKDGPVEELAAQKNLPLITFNAKLELEISELTPEEREEYEKEFGIGELPLERFIRTGHTGLGIITFYTVVGKEVRAWLLKKDSSAVQAAGKVHSDMERGFIKAQVIGFKDFKTVGSLKEAKEKGLLRLVGKDHTVNDGDIIEFKFHVA